jgi:hypothetical protein
MAFGFSTGALLHAADDRADATRAAAMVAHQAISVPTSLADNAAEPWHLDQGNDIWPLSVRLSLLGALSLASWGLVLGAGYALRAAFA